jgi:hypothetical protein
MAKPSGVSLGLVPRIWRAHTLQPHRLRTSQCAREPSFVAADIIMSYVDPLIHAVILSRQGADPAARPHLPVLPIKSRRCRTITRDY